MSDDEFVEIGKEGSSRKRRRESKASGALRLAAHRMHVAALLAHELRCYARCCDATLQALAVARVPHVLCNVAIDGWQSDAPAIESVRVITEWFSREFKVDARSAERAASAASNTNWSAPPVPTAARMRTVLRAARGHRREVMLAYVALCRGLRMPTRMVSALGPVVAFAAKPGGNGAARAPPFCQGCADASLWAEVWCGARGAVPRWVCVDPLANEVDLPARRETLRAARVSPERARAIELVATAVAAVRRKRKRAVAAPRRSTRCRVGYVVAIAERGAGAGLELVDVTRRYAASWAKSLALRRPTTGWEELLAAAEAASSPPMARAPPPTSSSSTAASATSSSSSAAAAYAAPVTALRSDVIDLTGAAPSSSSSSSSGSVHGGVHGGAERIRAPASTDTLGASEARARERAVWVARRASEEAELRRFAIEHEEIPTSLVAFRGHPTFCVVQALNRSESVLPGARAVGLFKGADVYLRSDVRKLRSEQQWHRLGRTVRADELERPARVWVAKPQQLVPQRREDVQRSVLRGRGDGGGEAVVRPAAVLDTAPAAVLTSRAAAPTDREAGSGGAAADADSSSAPAPAGAPELSVYERARARKLVRNARKLAALGIASSAESERLLFNGRCRAAAAPAAAPLPPPPSPPPPRAATAPAPLPTMGVDSRGILFGEWQTTPYVPPAAANGCVPTNEFGNVELWSPAHLPRGCVHMAKREYPRLAAVLRALGTSHAPAMVGFENKQGRPHPVLNGFIVCEVHAATLTEAHASLVAQAIEAAAEKRRQRRLRCWARMFKGVVASERLYAQSSERVAVAGAGAGRAGGAPAASGAAAAAVAAASAADAAAPQGAPQQGQRAARRSGAVAPGAEEEAQEEHAHAVSAAVAAADEQLPTKRAERAVCTGVLLGLDGLPMDVAGFGNDSSDSE